MAFVAKGTKVKVLNCDNGYHGLEVGSIVTATGEDYPEIQGSTERWVGFKDSNGYFQWMHSGHYEVLGAASEVKTPRQKIFYAVVDKDNEIQLITPDRAYAREEKFFSGGKAEGFRILKASLTLGEEIR